MLVLIFSLILLFLTQIRPKSENKDAGLFCVQGLDYQIVEQYNFKKEKSSYSRSVTLTID